MEQAPLDNLLPLDGPEALAMAQAVMTDDGTLLRQLITAGHGRLMVAPLRTDKKLRAPLLLAYWMAADDCLKMMMEFVRVEGLDLMGLQDGEGHGIAWYADHYGDGGRMSNTLEAIRAAVDANRFKEQVNALTAELKANDSSSNAKREPHRGL